MVIFLVLFWLFVILMMSFELSWRLGSQGRLFMVILMWVRCRCLVVVLVV